LRFILIGFSLNWQKNRQLLKTLKTLGNIAINCPEGKNIIIQEGNIYNGLKPDSTQIPLLQGFQGG